MPSNFHLLLFTIFLFNSGSVHCCCCKCDVRFSVSSFREYFTVPLQVGRSLEPAAPSQYLPNCRDFYLSITCFDGPSSNISFEGFIPFRTILSGSQFCSGLVWVLLMRMTFSGFLFSFEHCVSDFFSHRSTMIVYVVFEQSEPSLCVPC